MSGAVSTPRRIDAIVVGASAGGVEALLMLLPALPEGCRASVFVVLHLPRDTPSLLAGIFAPVCRLPVLEAVDKMTVEPGHVYVAPSDYHLLVDRGASGLVIALSTDEPVHWSRPSIDVLFETAADACAKHTLGIILTGWNRDGATGLSAIHKAGGVTVVQEPASAVAETMPATALAETPADHVLPLDGIAALLRSLGRDALLPAATEEAT